MALDPAATRPHRRAERGAARLALAALAAAALLPAPAEALRITTWNLWNYGNNDTGRQPHFRTVMANLPTDLMIVQELSPGQAGADSFLINVLRNVQPKAWGKIYIESTESAVFWDSALVEVTNPGIINPPNGPRDVLSVLVRVKGYATNAAWFRLYSVHLKAGDSSADTAQRRLECTEIRNALNTVNTSFVGPNFIVGGDFNMYGDWDGGYIRFLENQADNDGRMRDPIPGMTGTWNSPAHASRHTQSPCNTGCHPGFSGGGMDDRFDMWLTSYSLQDGLSMDLLLPSGYIPYGNDGQHYNDNIDGGGFNNAVGLTIASALRAASDHLPVILTLKVPAKIAAAPMLDFGSAIVGGSASRVFPVSNGALAPAEQLSYSFGAASGFTVPGGTFVHQAGSAPNNHNLFMSTSTVGVKSGVTTLTSNDADSSSKPVQLSGRVLRHAVASLDSAVVVESDTLDFGSHGYGGFADQAVRLHNVGWDDLQARLSVGSAEIVGGGGRFSLVGGFSGALLGGTGRTYDVRFDDSGASPDTTYTATLVFHTADEALPGAAPAADLSLRLVASVVVGTAGGPDAARPTALRLHPPRPNPLRHETLFAFDLPEAQPAALEVFDISGRRVALLASGERAAGRHRAAWRGVDEAGERVAGGLYFVRLSTPRATLIERIVVLP